MNRCGYIKDWGDIDDNTPYITNEILCDNKGNTVNTGSIVKIHDINLDESNEYEKFDGLLYTIHNMKPFMSDFIIHPNCKSIDRKPKTDEVIITNPYAKICPLTDKGLNEILENGWNNIFQKASLALDKSKLFHTMN